MSRMQFFNSRIRYYCTDTCQAALQLTKNASFNQQILLSGDININPGLVRNPCGNCKKSLAPTHRVMKCATCDLKVQIKCGGITSKEYVNLKRTGWDCHTCRLPNFSDSFFEVEGSTQSNQTVEQINQSGQSVNENIYDDLNEKILGSGLKIPQLNVNGLFHNEAPII